MIPKIIHYCWLSDDPYPPLINYCLKSWKKILSDYEIICWDRKRFNIASVPWVDEAYHMKKYAFSADYIRFHALYYYGGIYLDSDVEMLKTFNDLLYNKSFIGYENVSGLLEPAIIGAEKELPWCKKMMDFYANKHFSSSTIQIAPAIINELFISEFLDFPESPVNTPTLINNGGILLCPPEYFSPIVDDKDKNYNKHDKDSVSNFRKNPNIYCIHRFNGSWVSPSRKFFYDLVDKTIGAERVRKLMHFLNLR